MPTGLNTKKSVRIVHYDFNKHDGLVGSMNLQGATIPEDAIVTSAVVDVLTPVTGGEGAKISLGLEDVDDLKAEVAIASVTDICACVPNGSASNMVKTTKSCPVKMVVSGAPLTGGEFNVILEYIISD